MTDVATPAPAAPDLDQALSRLRELAGDLPIQPDWGRATLTTLDAGTHVAADGAAIGGFRVKGSGNLLFTGSGVDLGRLHVVLDARDSAVYIGPGVVVEDLSAIRMFLCSGSFVYVGARTVLVQLSTMLTGPGARLTIGEDCLLSSDIIVTNSDGHSVFDLKSGDAINPDANVTIGDRVAIGSHARIQKGAVIGRNSVVAAHSVVQTPLPADGYHVGFPARCRRRGIAWQRDEGGSPVASAAEQAA